LTYYRHIKHIQTEQAPTIDYHYESHWHRQKQKKTSENEEKKLKDSRTPTRAQKSDTNTKSLQTSAYKTNISQCTLE